MATKKKVGARSTKAAKGKPGALLRYRANTVRIFVGAGSVAEEGAGLLPAVTVERDVRVRGL